MPCSDGGPTREQMAQASPGETNLRIDELKKRNDELASLLCQLFRWIEKSESTPSPMPAKLALWWENHKKQDEARLKALEKSVRKQVKDLDREEIEVMMKVLQEKMATE